MSAGATVPPEGISVLYIQHSAAFSGALRSLLDLLGAFTAGAVRPRVITPRGAAMAELERNGYPVLAVRGFSQFDTTRFGHYRGVRWLILLRELAYLPATVLGILSARRRWPEVDLIHANEITALPAALLAKLAYRKPLVVHVRSVQQTQGAQLRRALARWLLERFADAVVAIDDTVRASLPAGLEVRVVRNGFEPGAAGEPLHQPASSAGALRVGLVGSLLPLKGVPEFLEAARLCAERGANVEFVVAGAQPRDAGGVQGRMLRWLGFAQDVEGEMRRFIARHGLAGRVHAVGFVRDLAVLYRGLDVVCFPSHLDAVGRPVLEAAWFGVPSIAAVSKPAPDTFLPDETGIAIPARDPQALAQAILRLEARRDEARRMGEAALGLARRNFDSRRNAAQMLRIYEDLLENRKRSALAA